MSNEEPKLHDIEASPSPDPTEKDEVATDPKWVQMVEEIEVLLAFNFFGICGSMARNGLVQLTAFENLGSVWPNVAACFIIALAPAMFGPKLATPVGTGLCGALSSFSELITDIFSEATTPKRNWPDHGHDHGWGVPLFMARLIVEMSCCFASYLAGSHAGQFLEWIGWRKLPDRTELGLRRICEALGIAAWIVCLVTTITSHNHVRWWPLCGLFAPFGVWLRFYLSKLNADTQWFKLGTFLANALGTTVACVCVLCLHLPSISPLQVQMVTGFQRGFTGCLSTISTFVKELNGLELGKAYMYGIISLFVGYSLAFIIVGSYIWTR